MQDKAAHTSLPLAAYIRVSRKGTRDDDRLRSPDLQWDLIQHGGKTEGRDLIRFDPEIDVSGAKTDRVVLDSILEQIEAGELGGIMVAKLDRLSRMKPKDRIMLFERVESAGGVILSASEALDQSTPEGRFARDVFLGVARMQWEKYAQAWDHAKTEAHGQGMKIGPTPFGYLREGGFLVPHPTEGPIVVECYRITAEQGINAGMEYLTGLGLVHAVGKRQGRERRWTTATTRRLLANRTYLGEARYGDMEPNLNAHPALVTRAVWEAAQTTPTSKRRPARAFPLSGIARCACGAPMVGGNAGAGSKTYGAGGVRTYRCSASLSYWKGERCAAPANITADSLEQFVRAEIADALSGQLWSQPKDVVDLDAAQAELAKREALESSVLSDPDLQESMGHERFKRYAATIMAAADEARATYREVAQRSTRGTVSLPEADVVLTGPPELLRSVALALGLVVSVVRGRGMAVEDRASVSVADPVAAVAVA